MTGQPWKRFRLEPVLDRLDVEDRSLRSLARVLSADPSTALNYHTLLNAKAHGGLTRWMADRAAIGVGVHPVLLWPDFNDDLAGAP